ncbi:hypothetical protein [Hyphomicrobium sp.]|nr:hypothetical protein [Hyphomicrobium sp.]MBY0561487.1 hypothetical protein [Hyphomicrobium sp.]
MRVLKLLFLALIAAMWWAHQSGYDGISAMLVGVAGYVAGTHDVLERLAK